MFVFQLSVILIAALLGGYVCKYFKQPTVLGQLVMGIVIGPSVLALVQPTETFVHLSELGVIMLMFIAGLETDLKELIESGKSSTAIAMGGVVLPLLMGFGVTMLFGKTLTEGAFIGVILCATSVSITVETLREMNRLKTKQGITILSAAVIDDVIGIILLSLVIGFVNPDSGQSFLFVLLKIILFFVLSIGIGIIVVRYGKKLSNNPTVRSRIATFALAFCFLMSFISEELGVAAITGAYVTGVILSSTPFRHKVNQSVQELSFMLLTPIFFVVTGMKVDILHIFNDIGFGLSFLLVAVFAKLVGCSFMANLMGYSKSESLQVGIGMIPRGEVALIIVNIGLKMSIISDSVFTAVILMIVVTTLVTPGVLKMSFDKSRQIGGSLSA